MCIGTIPKVGHTLWYRLVQDNFRQMSELLIVHNGKIFHKDRASIPHSDQTKQAFMSAMVA